MLVIADSSPFILLTNIGHVDILPALFETVTIPPEVAAELAKHNRPLAVRQFIGLAPNWLVIRAPKNMQCIPSLDDGENAAISLAIELKAELPLIEENRGRKAAADRNITLTGTIGVLERAAGAGLLDFNDAFDRVKTTDFWISHKLLDERLTLYHQRRKLLEP